MRLEWQIHLANAMRLQEDKQLQGPRAIAKAIAAIG